MRTATLALIGLTALAPAHWNDAAISFGGAAASLSSHPTVRMLSERVALTIGEKYVDADCTFVFRNDGPACEVQMGFPDEGEGAFETTHYEDVAMAKDRGAAPPVFRSFLNFKSYVDGRSVPTDLVGDKNPEAPRSWRVKSVKFASGQARTVREKYQVPVGMALTNSNGTLSLTRYIVHSGASWKGSIGRAEIVVVFRRRTMPAKLKAVPLGKLTKGPPFAYSGWKKAPKSNVYYRGFTFPTVSGSTLRFVRYNLEPTKDSDISIYFDHTR